VSAGNSSRPQLVIAVDGPSGSGKSSISKESAKRLGLEFLDTGAMYRAFTWFCLSENIENNESAIKCLNDKIFHLEISTSANEEKISVNDRDLTLEIRKDGVTAKVSFYAAIPEVRKFMVEKQRAIVKVSKKGIIVEGRDIGSVVLPDADYKIFITASEEVRAKRRALQNDSDAKDVLELQRQRDLIDSNRKVSPLSIPEGAVILDNTELNFEQSVQSLLNIVKKNS
jgi:cytidylate kinase